MTEEKTLSPLLKKDLKQEIVKAEAMVHNIRLELWKAEGMVKSLKEHAR